MVYSVVHQFYCDGTLLFTLEDAVEYDTATPYRYVVGRFVNVADRIRQGQSVTVTTRSGQERTVVLQTVAHLMEWMAMHFSGFERYVH